MTNQIVQLMLPWFGNHDGELYYSPMNLSTEGNIDRRQAFRIIRKWYKDQIGITVDKTTIQKIWARRHVTRAVSQGDINNYLHELARNTYEETVQESDTDLQEGIAE